MDGYHQKRKKEKDGTGISTFEGVLRRGGSLQRKEICTIKKSKETRERVDYLIFIDYK